MQSVKTAETMEDKFTPRSVVAFDIDGEQIRAIYLIANPEKLAQLSGGARSKVNPSFDQN